MGKEPSGANINEEQRIYEDFAPYCRWHPVKEKDIINIELKGFRKEQLHVKLHGRVIEISGEQPLDPPKWQRFRKEIKLENGCNANDISAHFSAGTGILSITIPKTKSQEFGRQLINSSLGFKVGLVTLLVLVVVFATYCMPQKIWTCAAKL